MITLGSQFNRRWEFVGQSFLPCALDEFFLSLYLSRRALGVALCVQLVAVEALVVQGLVKQRPPKGSYRKNCSAAF